MKLLLLTYGTEGDTRPITALGHALLQAGHDVHLLGDRSTLGPARALGLASTALAGDIRATMSGGDVTRKVTRLVQRHTPDWLQQAIDAGRDCDAIVVSGLTAFVGLSAAEALRVPVIGAMLIPISGTSEFPSPFLPFTPPRALNHAGHWLFSRVSWQVLRGATNEARTRAGLPPRRRIWDAHPMLYGVSPALVPPPADWPANAHVCGQWIPPLAGSFVPPDALRDFLDAGEPPVYVGFGSMAGFNWKRIEAAVAGALGGRRALFHAGWSDIDPTRLPDNVHAIGQVPHDWLLPRCSMAIHHGGSGTTHSTCRAGIPSVVVPFAADQFFWAARLREADVMRHTLRRHTLTAKKLADAIAFAETDGARDSAARLGARMRQEDGCAAAVALIERYVPARTSDPAQER